jgi:glycosyltransferase involved in cell wall biosynthesis
VTNSSSCDTGLSGPWIVVAAYNEGAVLGEVVAGLLRHHFQVVVVDDGSCDDTSEAVLKTGAHLVRHPVNLGQGAALQTGIEFALNHGAEYIVTYDADGQHDLVGVFDLLKALKEANADIACGSRFLGKALNIPKARKAMLKAAAAFTNFTTGVKMTDAHNGLRAMTRSCAQKIRIRQNRMAHASEIIGEIARHKFKYIEVPVVVSYSPYSLRKGQKMTNLVNILTDLFMQGLYR